MTELSLTLKYGSGYAEPWTVLKAETVPGLRQAVLDYFGLDEESAKDYPTLHELVDAVRLSMQGQEPAPKPAPQQERPQVAVPPTETDQGLLEKVKAASSTAELGNLWKANKDKWDSALTKAAAERKKELSA